MTSHNLLIWVGKISDKLFDYLLSDSYQHTQKQKVLLEDYLCHKKRIVEIISASSDGQEEIALTTEEEVAEVERILKQLIDS